MRGFVQIVAHNGADFKGQSGSLLYSLFVRLFADIQTRIYSKAPGTALRLLAHIDEGYRALRRIQLAVLRARLAMQFRRLEQSHKLVDETGWGGCGSEAFNSTPNPVVTSSALAGFAVAFAFPFEGRFSGLGLGLVGVGVDRVGREIEVC